MSTRASIIFIGPDYFNKHVTWAIRLYQHADGYPAHVLPTLQNAMAAVRAKMAAHWQRTAYNHPGVEFDFFTVPINAETMAGCYVYEETSGYGMGAHIEEMVSPQTCGLPLWDDETREKVFGYREDLEWVYVVNSIDRYITVFGGKYSGLPAWTYTGGATVNPTKSLEGMVEKYQETYGKKIEVASQGLKNLGFPVNPK